MKALQNISIRARLLAAFGVMVALLVVSTVVGYSKLLAIYEDLEDIAKNRFTAFEGVALVGEMVTASELALRGAVNLALDDEGREVQRSRKDEYWSQVEDGFARYAQVPKTAQGEELERELRAALDSYLARVKKTEALRDSKGLEPASDYLVSPEGRKAFDEARETADKALERNRDLIREQTVTAANEKRSAETALLATLLASIALATWIGLTISTGIAKGLGTIAEVIRSLAQGDLRPRVAIQGKDEIAAMGTELNKSFDSLATVLRQVEQASADTAETSENLVTATEQVGSSTQQIAQSIEQVASGASQTSESMVSTQREVDDLSRTISQVSEGSERQARMLQSTANTLRGVAGQINDSAERARTAAESARQVLSFATKGKESVDSCVAGMDRIRETSASTARAINELGEASQRINAIVEAIDDIAAQTNLLALNAAIEAARAGEHGRGFAVVAEEVRKLAERSSSQTKEIADLIANIQGLVTRAVESTEVGTREVQAGSDLVLEAGEALQEISTNVGVTAQEIQSVATVAQAIDQSATAIMRDVEELGAIAEQTLAATASMETSSRSVMGSVQEVSAVSQQNAAATQEVSAATEETSASVEEMVASTNQLASNARRLQGLVSQFKIDPQTNLSVIDRDRLAA